MPWKTSNLMSLREEFVELASAPEANRRELMRRFGIAPATAYKWLGRYAASGTSGLADRSKRPGLSPRQSDPGLEAQVVELRRQHPAWGGRKISRRLADLGRAEVAPSTVTSILHRHGLIRAEDSARSQAWIRFEREAPNALWQVDFKGHFDIPPGRCTPLTMLDDHSRFNLALSACDRIDTAPVRHRFEQTFLRYGLPAQMNFDNGAPWGSPRAPGQLTALTAWLVRLGIRVTHSRPYHPQTNGKDERFHRSLKAEVLAGQSFASFLDVQQAFDRWRHVYNCHRPHDALGLATPITRYRPSPRPLPASLPPIAYPGGELVIRVRANGELRFRDRSYRLSNALVGEPVAVRPQDGCDGCFDVYFLHHHCLTIDLRQPITQ